MKGVVIVMDNSKRVNGIDNVKWLLTLLVILVHIAYRGNGGKSVFVFIQTLGDFAVQSFALISGFFFWRNVKQFSDLKEKFRNRVTTLLIPYVLWNLINVIVNNIMQIGIKNIDRTIFNLNLLNDIILGNSSPHLWYIFLLMFWTVFAPLLYFAYNDKRFLIIMFLSQAIYIFIKGENILHSRFIYIVYTWGGLLGYTKPNLFKDMASWDKKRKIIVSSIAALIWLLGRLLITIYDPKMNVRVWLFLIENISFILFAFNIPPLYFGKLTGYRYMFWIYAVHFWLCNYLGKVVAKFVEFALLYQVITFTIVFIISLISGILMRRVCPWGFALLTGGRTNRSEKISS